MSKPPAPSNLARDSSGLDIVGGHRRDSLVLVRIEGLSFGLDWLYPELAESIEEQAVRCGDALVKWRVRGARRERAFERVERGKSGSNASRLPSDAPFRAPAPSGAESSRSPRAVEHTVLLFTEVRRSSSTSSPARRSPLPSVSTALLSMIPAGSRHGRKGASRSSQYVAPRERPRKPSAARK